MVILSTGSELREPGTPLGHDSVYDGNSLLLAASARRAGAIAYRVGIVPDEPRAFLDALSDQLVRADLVVTSGGVSQGDYDVVKEALRPSGSVWFGGVKMQPGKPQGFGTVGEDETPIFTLPGNPVSSYISFETFVLPAIRKLMGKTPLLPAEHAGPAHPRRCRRPPGRRQFMRGSYEVDRGGPLVSPVGGAGSHLIGDLASSNALIIVPEDVDLGDRRGAGAGAVCWTRSSDGGGAGTGRADPRRRVRRGADGRRVRQGRHRPDRHRVGSGAGLGRGGRAAAGKRRTQGGHAGRRPARRDHGRQADAVADPALPPAVDLRRHRRPRPSATTSVDIRATVRTTDRTGVEMEALTAVSVAALTVVDMVKAVDKAAVITDVRVETKTGGKSGDWVAVSSR